MLLTAMQAMKIARATAEIVDVGGRGKLALSFATNGDNTVFATVTITDATTIVEITKGTECESYWFFWEFASAYGIDE